MKDKIIELLERYIDENRDYSSVATEIHKLYTEPVSEEEIQDALNYILQR